MSNEMNINKLYQFLAKFEVNGNSWINAADGAGNCQVDGHVIKSEFRAFMEENFEWNGETDTQKNDLINTFWKKIDTNTSSQKIAGTRLQNLNALDDKEVGNLDKKLETYVQMNEFINKNVKAPSVLATTGTQWKTDVVVELSAITEEFINNGCNGDINTLLSEKLPAIANRLTAEYCAVEYQEVLMDGVLADFKDYKVADDSALQSLIQAYVATIDNNIDANQIKADIRAILDAYIASAGIGNGSEFDIEALGFDKNAINDIQKEVIKKDIKEALADEAKNYEGYENFFNEAVEKFINSKMQSDGNFEELKNCGPEFLTSKFKTQLDNIVTVEKIYRDIKDDSSFYKILIDEFGATLAKRISQSERDLAIYNEIVDNVVTKVANGELTMDEVADYVINEIRKNLTSFYGDSLGNLAIEELNTLYDDLAKSAEAEKDNAKSLQLHKDAAIKYCQALSDKNKASLTKLIKEIFGTTDFRSAINSITMRGDLFEKMTELKEKALNIAELTCTYSASPKIETIGLGNTKETTISATINNGNINNTTNDVKFVANVRSGGGSVTIDDLGNLSITAPTSGSVMKVEVYVTVDGEKVEPALTMVINCINTSSADIIADKVTGWGNSKSEHLEVAGGGNDGKQVTDIDFKTLYKNDAVITLHNARHDEPDTAWNGLSELGNYIVNALKTAGLDENTLKIAKENVINQYTQQGVKYYYESKSRSENDRRQNIAHNIQNRDESEGCRHTVVHIKSRSKECYAVSFKDLVDDILAEYNRLI